MMDMIGSEKQIKWALNIIMEANKTLNELKKIVPYPEDIDVIIENLNRIKEASYIISNLKELTYTKNRKEKMKIILDWVIYTEHPDFKDLKIVEIRKII